MIDWLEHRRTEIAWSEGTLFFIGLKSPDPWDRRQVSHDVDPQARPVEDIVSVA